jgi:hypothetical protein
LSSARKKKQFNFVTHITNYWGLPQLARRKLLWVHYDENGFWLW